MSQHEQTAAPYCIDVTRWAWTHDREPFLASVQTWPEFLGRTAEWLIERASFEMRHPLDWQLRNSAPRPKATLANVEWRHGSSLLVWFPNGKVWLPRSANTQALALNFIPPVLVVRDYLMSRRYRLICSTCFYPTLFCVSSNTIRILIFDEQPKHALCLAEWKQIVAI